MKKIIHHVRHLRQKPEKVRRHILHVTVMACAFVLGLLWIYSLGTNVANLSAENKTSETKPLSALKANLIGGYKSFSDEGAQ